MRRLFLLLLLQLLLFSSIAQDNYLDSLKRLISTSQDDTLNVQRILVLSGANVYSKPDSGLLYAKKALEISQKISYGHGEARSYFLIGSCFDHRKVWLDALRDAADHSPQPFVKGRSKILIRFGTTATSTVGNKILIGKVGSNDVELRCIAGWGNTLSENGEIVANPKPGAINGNNYTLAFVLSCGQFRYFIGADNRL